MSGDAVDDEFDDDDNAAKLDGVSMVRGGCACCVLSEKGWLMHTAIDPAPSIVYVVKNLL